MTLGAYVGGDLAFVDGVSWRWDDNPFVGTNELAGLKLMVMLLGNWDNKDLH